MLAITGLVPTEVLNNCRTATDGCTICKVARDGKLKACSTPGIACQPGKWRCSEPDAKPPKPPMPKPKLK